MFLTAFVLLAAVALASADIALPSDATDVTSVQVAFEAFKRQHNKVYESLDEEGFRLGVFQANMVDVARLNERAASRNSTARYGITPFSDLTVDEFRERYLMSKEAAKKRPHSLKIAKKRAHQGIDHEQDTALPLVGVPDRINWVDLGAVTPVKNQGQCGSCWAFSATEQIESAAIQAGLATNLTIALAPQQIVDCSSADMGCGGGHTEDAYNYVMSAGGLATNTTIPYKAVDEQCAFKKAEAAITIDGFSYATTFWRQSHMLQSLAKGPVSVCLDAANWQHYTSGVLTSWECDSYLNMLDHCVQAVGYDQNPTSGDPYYLVRNSWTTSWGIKGFIKLSLATYDTCGILNDATVVHGAKRV